MFAGLFPEVPERQELRQDKMSKEIQDITHKWSIPSISSFLDRKSDCSRVDVMQVTIKSVFKLQLNFTKNDEDQLNLYVLPLIPLSGFKFTLSRWLGDNTARISLPEATFECVPPINWILCQTMSVKQIKNELNAHYNSTINAVSITFEIKLCYDNKIQNSEDELSMLLINDLEQLLISGKFHDALIKTTEGTELKVHKSILASRCEVLNAAFQHDLIESATNIIETQFDDETMEHLLLYIYCHKTPKIKTIVEKVLVAANYYQLNALKFKCEEILVEHLSGDNALEYLELAVTHACTILEKGVLNFINDKSISDIVKSEDWLQSANIEVFKKICEHCVILFNKI